MVTLWMEWFSSVMADIRNGMTCARYIAGRNSADCVESNASVGVGVSDGPKWLRRVLTGINGAPQCGRGVRPDEGDLPLRHLCDGQRQRDDDKRRRAMSCALTCVFGMHVRVCRHSLGDVQMRHLRPKLGAERLFGMCWLTLTCINAFAQPFSYWMADSSCRSSPFPCADGFTAFCSSAQFWCCKRR